jgi:hypothetical protein
MRVAPCVLLSLCATGRVPKACCSNPAGAASDRCFWTGSRASQTTNYSLSEWLHQLMAPKGGRLRWWDLRSAQGARNMAMKCDGHSMLAYSVAAVAAGQLSGPTAGRCPPD